MDTETSLNRGEDQTSEFPDLANTNSNSNLARARISQQVPGMLEVIDRRGTSAGRKSTTMYSM